MEPMLPQTHSMITAAQMSTALICFSDCGAVVQAVQLIVEGVEGSEAALQKH